MADAKHAVLNPGWYLPNLFVATNFAIDQTTDQVEFIFQAEEAMTITRLGFRYGARTGTPPVHKISLQGVDTTVSAIPDGTIKGGGSPASKTFTPPADATWDGTWQWITLDNAYTCTRGELLASVIAYSSGTVDGSNNSSFTVTDQSGPYQALGGFPAAISNNAGSHGRSAARPVFAYGPAGAVFGYPQKTAFAPAAITSTTTPDEYATTFTLPTGWGSTYQVAGIHITANIPAAKSMKMQLYSGTTVLQTATLDTDLVVNGAQRQPILMFNDTTLVDLKFGAQYRIGIQPQDAAGNYSFFGFTQDSNAEWGAHPLGTDWYMSSRTDAGAWTDDTTTRLACALILKDIKKPAPGIIVAT